MIKDLFYKSHAKAIKSKIFWYFLFKGILLYKFQITVQDRFGNSDNAKGNEDWWPHGDLIKVSFICRINKKLFWASIYENKLDVEVYRHLKIKFLEIYKSGEKRLGKKR